VAIAISIGVSLVGAALCLVSICMANKPNHKNRKAEVVGAIFAIGMVILLGSETVIITVLHYDNQAEAKEALQVELEPGYYKVHLIREEKDKTLTAVVEDSNGKIQVMNLPKHAPIGWDANDSVLKVFLRDNVTLYYFMDSIE